MAATRATSSGPWLGWAETTRDVWATNWSSARIAAIRSSVVGFMADLLSSGPAAGRSHPVRRGCYAAAPDSVVSGGYSTASAHRDGGGQGGGVSTSSMAHK